MLVIIEFVYRKNQNEHKGNIDICEKEHCNCHKNGIIKASLIHTLNITKLRSPFLN